MTGGGKVSEVKAALGSAIAEGTNIRTYDYQPDQVNPPFIFPSLESVEYHGAFQAGLVTQTYNVTAVVGRVAERSSERLLDTLLSYGSASVRYAVEQDPTLGGAARASVVQSAGRIASLDASDATYLSCEWRVIVYA
jgi:hypothetical protein